MFMCFEVREDIVFEGCFLVGYVDLILILILCLCLEQIKM